MILGSEIDELLESKKSKLMGQTKHTRIRNVFSRALSCHNIKFKLEYNKDFKKRDYAISGVYNTNTDKINVIIHFTPKHELFCINDKMWNEFKFTISQTCQHELIHRYQTISRENVLDGNDPVEIKFASEKLLEEKKYLSDLDEIEAYAHDLAMEIKHYYPKKSPYDVLRNIDRHKKLWSYFYYKRTFQTENWIKIRKRLLKKAFMWIPHTKV